MRLVRVVSVPLLAAALATPASPQIVVGQGVEGQYESLYGPPTPADLEDVAHGAGTSRRVVTVEGSLDVFDYQRHYYRLRDGGVEVLMIPVPSVADDVRRLIGRRVPVTGLVREVPERQSYSPGCGLDSQCQDPQLPALPSREGNFQIPEVSITVWSGVDATDFDKVKEDNARLTTLETLVGARGREDGKPIRVVGKFRGKNLFGDLPSKSQRRSDDWVIKDDVYAVWITGKKPKGGGEEGHGDDADEPHAPV
jgi:hypothetical protein